MTRECTHANHMFKCMQYRSSSSNVHWRLYFWLRLTSTVRRRDAITRSASFFQDNQYVCGLFVPLLLARDQVGKNTILHHLTLARKINIFLASSGRQSHGDSEEMGRYLSSMEAGVTKLLHRPEVQRDPLPAYPQWKLFCLNRQELAKAAVKR